MVEYRWENSIIQLTLPAGADQFGKTRRWNTFARGNRTDIPLIAPDGRRWSDNERTMIEQLCAGHLFALKFARRGYVDFPEERLFMDETVMKVPPPAV